MARRDRGATASPEAPKPIPQELAAAVRKEAVSYASKMIIATAAAVAGAAVLGLWLYVKAALPSIAGGVPANAVMAFDADTCPSGWSPFLHARARTIVGIGNPAEAPDNTGVRLC